MQRDPANPPSLILATDCGSTTTKAILIERIGDECRLRVRGEAPTTVEAPFDDVTIGAANAIAEVEDLTGRKILEDGRVVTPRRADGAGVDLYVSTSSAGGGLQMMVAGVVRAMSAESAERAALGAGAIVMDVLSIDDARKPHERIARIRELRPDIVLLSGGVDGGDRAHVTELAELILAADPAPRFGNTLRLPLVYAGNSEARDEVERLLAGRMSVKSVANIRPVLEREDLAPARDAIHEVFLSHVMSHAPGYDKLMQWTSVKIMPTPAAVGAMVETVARERGLQVLAVDIGGATTDVFSVFGGVFNRTVSANLGMSYSICNGLLEAGIERIVRWLPFRAEPDEIRDRLRNKMIRPTTIPQTLEDLFVEQAVCREALRLAFDHHKMIAVGLKGVRQERTIAEAFSQSASGDSLVDMMGLNLVIGSGGVLSHAPARAQAALMLLDAYQPQGITELAVDSIFMMPQLGVLSTICPEVAAEVFDRDCLVRLGTVVAPVGKARRAGEAVATAKIILPDGRVEEVKLAYGELRMLPLGPAEEAELRIRPGRRFDVGNGPGKEYAARVRGGACGIILDARGRPLTLPAEEEARVQTVRSWFKAMGLEF